MVSWAKANLFDASDDPITANNSPTQVPMFAPRTIAIAAGKVIKLLMPRDITKAARAALLWNAAVTSIPAINPYSGNCPKVNKKSLKPGSL